MSKIRKKKSSTGRTKHKKADVLERKKTRMQKIKAENYTKKPTKNKNN